MKQLRTMVAVLGMMITAASFGQSKVYMTKEITPESLVKIYKALGREANGRVAVKISTGEAGGNNYLKPTLIRQLVEEVNGTVVECNTAYPGKRNTVEAHWQTIHEHGFDSIFAVDLMDEFGTIRIPVKDKKHIKYDIVGSHLPNYDFMINLAHFKGHAMGGFGGVLKNASIGVASSAGKTYIHTAGKVTEPDQLFQNLPEQDFFLESMAAAAQGVHEYFALASTDPVALDQACLDLVFNHTNQAGDTAKPLTERIQKLHGTHTVDYAEQIGLGSKKYELISIDK
jgi:uncharacterized Fe-S center protein